MFEVEEGQDKDGRQIHLNTLGAQGRENGNTLLKTAEED